MIQLVNERHLLRNPLGKLIAQSHHRCRWYYDIQDNIIFDKDGSEWTSYHRAGSATRTNPVYF